MKWQHIRQQHPHQWLLIEAISAHSEAKQRILDDMAVVDAFPDSITAFQRYKSLQREAPQRELYVLHTDRKELDITEHTWLGIRAEKAQSML